MKRYISAGRAITYNKPEAEAALKNAIKWVQNNPEFQDAYPGGKLKIAECNIERLTRPVQYVADIKIDFLCPGFEVDNTWKNILYLYGLQVPTTPHIDIDYFCDDSVLNKVLDLLKRAVYSSDLDLNKSFSNFEDACNDLCNQYGISGELDSYPAIGSGSLPSWFDFLVTHVDSFGNIPKNGFIENDDPKMHLYITPVTHIEIDGHPVPSRKSYAYPIDKKELSYEAAIKLLEPQFEATDRYFNELNNCIDLYEQLEPIYLKIRDQLIDKWGNIASKYAWKGLEITTSEKFNIRANDVPVLHCEGKLVEDVSDLKKVRKSLDGKFRRLFKKSQNATPEYESPMSRDSYSFSD